MVLGLIIASVGVAATVVLISDVFGKSPVAKVLREDLFLLIFGPALLLWGIALIASARKP